MKSCPGCGSQYEDHVQFCPLDGLNLQPVGSSTAATATASAPKTASEPVPVPGQGGDPLVGSRLFGDYVITRKLGEGGMGSVYRAQNHEIDQTIAIKVLHGHAAKNEELVQRFNREAKVICRLTHPNIIRVFIFGRTPNDMIFLAMEYVEGRTLRDVIEKAGPMDELRAIAIMRQCLHALSEAHELGIVHRDLKPDNIMLTNFRGVSEFVKVLDFGIAKIKDTPGDTNQKLTQAGIVYGTPEYLSPEQAQAKELDGRSDLYSMGIIFYEMITGCVPFYANTAVAILSAHVYEQPQPPSKVSKRPLHPKIDEIVARAMSKDPAKRYATAMEFLSDLEDLESELTMGTATKTTVLDASQLDAVLKASLEAQARQKQQRLAADVPAPALQPGASSSQVGTAPAKGSGQTAILWTIIAGLVILLLMVTAALVYVNGQRKEAQQAPPAESSLMLEEAPAVGPLAPTPYLPSSSSV